MYLILYVALVYPKIHKLISLVISESGSGESSSYNNWPQKIHSNHIHRPLKESGSVRNKEQLQALNITHVLHAHFKGWVFETWI